MHSLHYEEYYKVDDVKNKIISTLKDTFILFKNNNIILIYFINNNIIISTYTNKLVIQ